MKQLFRAALVAAGMLIMPMIAQAGGEPPTTYTASQPTISRDSGAHVTPGPITSAWTTATFHSLVRITGGGTPQNPVLQIRLNENAGRLIAQVTIASDNGSSAPAQTSFALSPGVHATLYPTVNFTTRGTVAVAVRNRTALRVDSALNIRGIPFGYGLDKSVDVVFTARITSTTPPPPPPTNVRLTELYGVNLDMTERWTTTASAGPNDVLLRTRTIVAVDRDTYVTVTTARAYGSDSSGRTLLVTSQAEAGGSSLRGVATIDTRRGGNLNYGIDGVPNRLFVYRLVNEQPVAVPFTRLASTTPGTLDKISIFVRAGQQIWIDGEYRQNPVG